MGVLWPVPVGLDGPDGGTRHGGFGNDLPLTGAGVPGRVYGYGGLEAWTFRPRVSTALDSSQLPKLARR
jgi:hypothetical protein